MKPLTLKQKKEFTKQIKLCLEDYYSLPSCTRNQWRFNQRFDSAIKTIETAKFISDLPTIKGAQWGGKWGNYYRLIAVNSLGQYQYVAGFNPYKLLK